MAAVHSLMSGYINQEGVMDGPVDAATSAIIGHYVYIPERTVVAVKSLGFTAGLPGNVLGAICAADGVAGTLTITNAGCPVRLTKFSAVAEATSTPSTPDETYPLDENFNYAAGPLTGKGNWITYVGVGIGSMVVVPGEGVKANGVDAGSGNQWNLDPDGVPDNIGPWTFQAVLTVGGNGDQFFEFSLFPERDVTTLDITLIWSQGSNTWDWSITYQDGVGSTGASGTVDFTAGEQTITASLTSNGEISFIINRDEVLNESSVASPPSVLNELVAIITDASTTKAARIKNIYFGAEAP